MQAFESAAGCLRCLGDRPQHVFRKSVEAWRHGLDVRLHGRSKQDTVAATLHDSSLERCFVPTHEVDVPLMQEVADELRSTMNQD